MFSLIRTSINSPTLLTLALDRGPGYKCVFSIGEEKNVFFFLNFDDKSETKSSSLRSHKLVDNERHLIANGFSNLTFVLPLSI